MLAHSFKPHCEKTGPAGAPCVLVADDDPTSRVLVGAALEGNFSVVEAENGLVAVECAGKQAFDLAILDLDMPVMDGFGVIERLRARADTRHLPIIVVTGRDDVVAIERAFALGATSFLCKPLNWNIFRHQVGYVLQVARLDRETRQAKERAEGIAVLRERSGAALEDEMARSAARLAALAVRNPPPGSAEVAAVGEALGGVLERVRRATDILTGATQPEPRSTGASDLAAAAVDAIRIRLGAATSDRIVVQEDAALRVLCDPSLAVQALAEVLANALLYSAPDQQVRLSLHDAPPDRVRFEIEDRGRGISERLLDRGFDAFGADRDGSEGLGLGIPVARAIAEQAGGHFGIMSELGRGTEVFLSFPSPLDFRSADRQRDDGAAARIAVAAEPGAP